MQQTRGIGGMHTKFQSEKLKEKVHLRTPDTDVMIMDLKEIIWGYGLDSVGPE